MSFDIDYAKLAKESGSRSSGPDFDLSEVEASSHGLDSYMGREEPKVASARRMIRVASMTQLQGFVRLSADSLVHLSTKDLWTAKREGDELVLERQFDDTGAPLRV